MRLAENNFAVRAGLALTTPAVAAVLAGCGVNQDPTPQREYATHLAANLAAGICRNTVAISSEADRLPAESYVQANGQPTDKCPDPLIDIEVICDPDITTGDFVDGSFIIRYSFSEPQPGTECVDSRPPTFDV